MSSLPANFPKTLPGIYASKAEWFYRRYVETYYAEYKFGHFLLAAYAAVPALITPDLLYKIWQNFSNYRWSGAPASIHRIAVSDLLLSPLLREIGFELYEMEQELRLAFLEWLHTIERDKLTLWSKRGIQPIDRIAGFVSAYHTQPNTGFTRWGRSYTEAQELEALSYAKPEQAVALFLEKLAAQSAGGHETALLQTIDRFIKLQQRLQRLPPDNAEALNLYRDKVQELEAVRDLIQKNSESLFEKTGSGAALSGLLSGTGQAGLKITLPADTRKKLEQLALPGKPPAKKIYAGLVGLNRFPSLTDKPFVFCEDNARRFADLLRDYAPAMNREIESRLIVSKNGGREELEELFRFYEQANEGDTCLFFYSGIGLMDDQYAIKGILFSGHPLQWGADDISLGHRVIPMGEGVEMYEMADPDQDVIYVQEVTRLQKMIAGKNIHVLVILDIQGIIKGNGSFPSFALPDNSGSSAVILQHFNADQSDLHAMEQHFFSKEANHFCQSLYDILSQGGYRLSYSALFMQLKLRMSRLDTVNPEKYAYPYDTGERIFLTGEEKTEKFFQLSFHNDTGWMVDAGSKHGIRPSLHFMETLFELEDRLSAQEGLIPESENQENASSSPFSSGFSEVLEATPLESKKRVAVQEVFQDHCTVASFNGEQSVIYRVALIQNALPKIRVAFADTMDQSMRTHLEDSIRRYDLYYIDLVDDPQDVYYLIDSREKDYLLIRRASAVSSGNSKTPVFDYQRDAYEFIKQLEYIAQWQGVLEFDNSETLMKKNNVWFDFEKIEGGPLTNGDQLPGMLIPGDEPVVLRYGKTDDRWYPPAFRCKATHVKINLSVSVLYLDSTYGITDIGRFYLRPGADEYLRFQIHNREYATLPVRIPDGYLQNGVTAATEYIKLFVSPEPLDIKALEQEELDFGSRQITRKGIGYTGRYKATFDVTGTDWIAVTIPVRIVREDNIAQKIESVINPLQGLTPYQEKESAYFFGREPVVQQLEEAVGKYDVVIVAAPAGSGKTSLVLAGLFPRVKRNTVVIRLTANNLISTMPLLYELRDNAKEEASVEQKVIFIDQYESLLNFTADDRRNFESTLIALAAYHTIVIAIRTDAETQFKDSLIVSLWRKRGSGEIVRMRRSGVLRIPIPLFSKTELRELVLKLFSLQSITSTQALEENLLEQITEDAFRSSPTLSYFSEALYRLFEEFIHRPSGPLTLYDYNRLGGIPGLQQTIGSKDFKESVVRLYNERTVTAGDDPQKGRWGGRRENNRLQLEAAVTTTDITGLYNLTITIRAAFLAYKSSGYIPTGQAAFFLPNRFENEIEYAAFSRGVATVQKNGVYEAFTIGAFTDDGSMLELDLNEQPGFPQDFYMARATENFMEKVRKLVISRPITTAGDPQKNRWGGLSVARGKELTATVSRSQIAGYHTIHLLLKPYHGSPSITGSVAFFLHDSYARQIVYRKAINGEVSLAITAFAAFTVGVYTADETMLELDLNQVEGYPEDFYYKPPLA